MSKKSELTYRGIDDHRWSGLLTVEEDGIHYCGSVAPDIRPHKLGALELIFALKGHILVRADDTLPWQDCKAVVVYPNQPRQVDVSNAEKCFFEFSLPGSARAWQICRNCSFENGIAVIPEQITEATLSLLYDLIRHAMKYGTKHPDKLKAEAKLLWNKISNLFGDPVDLTQELDARVLRALVAIHNRIPNWRVKEIIEEITKESWKQWKSGRQLRDIFKSQIEVTFKEYLSLLQMREALKKIAALKDALDITLKDSIDDAVKQAGFYDQSHFNQTSLKMLGIFLTPLIHNSQIIIIE